MEFDTLKFNRIGIQCWLLLRVSAIIILLYVIYIISFILSKNNIDYFIWRGFFSYTFTKVFTIFTLIAVLLHSWIGLWQVLTDYVKSSNIRICLYCCLVIILLYYFIYGVVIVLGVR